MRSVVLPGTRFWTAQQRQHSTNPKLCSPSTNPQALPVRFGCLHLRRTSERVKLTAAHSTSGEPRKLWYKLYHSATTTTTATANRYGSICTIAEPAWLPARSAQTGPLRASLTPGCLSRMFVVFVVFVLSQHPSLSLWVRRAL